MVKWNFFLASVLFLFFSAEISFRTNGCHKFQLEVVEEGEGDIDRLQFDLHNCQFAAQNYKETPPQCPDSLPSTCRTFMAPTNIFE